MRNRPEKTFRDDLKTFLNDRIAGTFNVSKEVELDSQNRLDVNITDGNGNYYFFEIKWVGTSINQEDTGESGTNYTEKDIKDGVSQTLEYIQELITKEEKTVKLGYLMIFDARVNKVPMALKPLNYIKDGLSDYTRMFEIVQDLALDNKTPR